MNLKRAVINTVKYAPLWIPGCLAGVTTAGVTGVGAFAERHAAEFAETRCVCDGVRGRMDFILDPETDSETSWQQYKSELRGAIHLVGERRKDHERGSYRVPYYYEGFQLLMSGSIPEDEDAKERTRYINRYLSFYNDVSERIPHLEEEEGFEEITSQVRADYRFERGQLLELLESQGRPDLIGVVEEFEHETQVLQGATEGWEGKVGDLSVDFVVNQKELANIIYENFATMIILGENPMADDSVETVNSYDDLMHKYQRYFEPPLAPSRVERGILVMHYLTMLAQVYDDLNGQYADRRFGILNLPTFRQAQGFSEEEIYDEMMKWADYYGCSSLSLKTSPRLFTLMGLGMEKGFPILLDQYREGSKRQKSSTNSMREEMAKRGYFDPPA